MQLRLIFVIFLLFLSGCASIYFDNATVKENWQQELITKKQWEVSGKLAIISPEKRQSANLFWQTTPLSEQLELTSFIGTSVLSLKRENGITSLNIDGRTHTSNNAQQLVYQLTGLNLPFVDNTNWLKGLPDTTEFSSDELNRVTMATITDSQNKQWQIKYNSYQKHGGYWLPYSVVLSHQNISLKLKVYSWQI